MGCMSDLKRNFCIQVFLFLVIFITDSADLLSDWLFFNDMRLQQEGLVFGPIDKKLLYALLGFSCVGVVTFFIEIINFGREIFKPDERSWIDVDYLSTVVIWLEEIPQVTISVMIAGCREEGVSIFQISKASIVILGSLGRLIIAIVRYCLRKRRGEYDSRRTFRCCSGILLFGLILSMLGSSCVFVFSHIQRNGNTITLQEPKEFLTSKLDTSKYFPHVGIYLHGNELRNGIDQIYKQDQWIKLMDLRTFEKNQFPAQKIKFKKNGNMKILIQSSYTREYGKLTTQTIKTECYNETNGWFVSKASCLNLFDDSDQTAEFVIYYNFLPQSSQLLMGDITYNTRYTDTLECFNSVGNNTKLNLKYFKAKDYVVDEKHLLLPNAGVFKTLYKFYTSENLIPIKEAWETGFIGCKSSGSEEPHWDRSIKVKCFKV